MQWNKLSEKLEMLEIVLYMITIDVLLEAVTNDNFGNRVICQICVTLQK